MRSGRLVYKMQGLQDCFMPQNNNANVTLKEAAVYGVDVNEMTLSFKRLFLGSKKQRKLWKFPILTDLNLEIKAGERVGVIGPNGAGKSTLLKTIAGIYPLSQGNRFVQGSIAPILEMGLGFDSFASGRVNIKLALLHAGGLAMYNKEFEKDVIEFADIGEFIDRPMAIYSKGMRSRLAFSIAFYRKADILLMDEVFATGDQNFKQKAVELLIKNINETPITIMVSHDFSLIQSLCTRCIIVDNLKVIADGKTDDIIDLAIHKYGESKHISELIGDAAIMADQSSN